MILEGIFRRWFPLKAARGNIDLRMTHNESIAVCQVEAPAHDRTRAGRTYILGNSAAITGKACVEALPTTVCQWVLCNLDPARAYFFEEIGVYLTSGTPSIGGGVLLVTIIQQPTQLGNTYAGTSITNASNGGLQSKMIVAAAVTSTQPTAPVWYPLAQSFDTNTTAFAGSTYIENRNIQGGIIIPPGQMLGINVLADTAGSALFAPFARWYEVESDLE
jgi:hypothetical protein